MKKIIISIIISLSILTLTGCSNKTANEKKVNNYLTIKPTIDGKIVINTENITSDASFVNYETDGVIIQFIVVRGTDGNVRIAFNTCQACNPSPKAYFIQNGEYIECQNCGNKFHIDQIGIEKGGCNPAPVEEKEETENSIIIDQEYANSYRTKFINWAGPTK